ncbi:RadC family protein [Celerinatantimonas yamalensis]|uniref:DNA repair protein RadC n=1 Tax=Celerinatantimonas yamalensis TaxID=559956 RepID=A0ABW9GBL8_9GAMM
MTILSWPASERPREKLLAQGAKALSDAELLAIFLRTGCQGMDAVALARHLLSDFGSLRALLSASQDSFCTHHGVGLAKYSQLQAALEMSRRYLHDRLQRGDSLNNPQLAFDYLQSELSHFNREVFALLLLDNQHRVLQFAPIFYGTIDAASVYPRVVVQQVLEHNAAAVILAHNHPSGIAEPSHADRMITDKLVQALTLIDVRVLDHIVVGCGQIVSFAQRGWI